MRISVLVVDDVFDTGLASILDTFETANELAGQSQFEITLTSPRAHVRTHLGFNVPVAPLPARAPELVIVPALACKQPGTIVAALDRPAVVALCDTIASLPARTRIAAACTGTFVLGKAGVLDGRRATTSWWLGPTFRRAFPEVELEEGEMVVGDTRVLTAGAALAHVDLALAVVRQRSPDLAATVARYLLAGERSSQAQFSIPSQVAHDDEMVKRFERWMRRHLSEPFELARVAKSIGTSERTLQRRLRDVLGKPPIAFVQDLRLEHAVRLLRQKERTVDEVAVEVGYENASTLRTLLRRKLQAGVRELR